MAPDYAGGVLGLAFSLVPLALVQPAGPVAWAMAAAAALFLVYFGRTVCRQLTHIELDETGIRARGPLGVAIRWEDLRSLRLDYYSTRRDPEVRTVQGGWMQLRLRDAQRTIRIDSELEGFVDLVRAVSVQARRLGIEFDFSTRVNLGVLGLAE
ncbi:MAG: hypothetical protein H7Y16_02155 [Candidatus Parcubacteria bacterium]|nr:hypothetical protein [Burkholderiales bacterium]